MKAFIEIEGQINGNTLLKNRIQIGDGCIESRPTRFYGFRVYFKTIKQAKQALKEAYHSMIRENPQDKNKLGGFRLINNGEELQYDASSAVMLRDNW